MLEKTVWTNDDFEVMGWHDAHLYSFLAMPDTFELAFDIDYIVEWVQPEPPEISFTFWVSSATLIFEYVQNISVQIEMQYNQGLEIMNLHRQPLGDKGNFHWVMELSVGKMEFDSSGYTQFFRSAPILTKSQSLGIEKRGGVSFSREPFGSNYA